MNNEVILINIIEMVNLFGQVTKSTFINIVSQTMVRMKKTGNTYYNRVFKTTSGNYLIGNDYEQRVLGNGEKEGISKEENSFQVESSKVGVHVSKCVLFNEGKNTHYLTYERFNEQKPKVEYTFEGNTIEKVMFEQFMYDYTESKKQDQERKVLVQTLKLSNIREFTLNGQRYRNTEFVGQ